MNTPESHMKHTATQPYLKTGNEPEKCKNCGQLLPVSGRPNTEYAMNHYVDPDGNKNVFNASDKTIKVQGVVYTRLDVWQKESGFRNVGTTAGVNDKTPKDTRPPASQPHIAGHVGGSKEVAPVLKSPEISNLTANQQVGKTNPVPPFPQQVSQVNPQSLAGSNPINHPVTQVVQPVHTPTPKT